MQRKTGAKPEPTRRKLRPIAAIIASIALLALLACGGAATPIPTATPEPATATPRPTATASPTATSAPAATPEPTTVAVTVAAVAPTHAPATTAPAATPAPPTIASVTPEPAAPAETPAAAPPPEPTATPAPTPTATAAAVASTETATPAPTAAPPPPCDGAEGGRIGDCAPDFAGTQEWINSEPLSMANLRGQVVLIDFWTYSCINCLRTLPYLQEWHQRYAADGLVIVGVHTPEFEFEKLYDNVAQATVTEGVAWPVVQDNDYKVWRSYANRFWPAKYLIDQSGEIRYRHFGEGKYAETEAEIRKLLAETGADSEALAMPLPSDQQRDGNRRQTRELFAGWWFTWENRRGGIGQEQTYVEAAQTSRDVENRAGVLAQFEMPSTVKPNLIYFQGDWIIGPESARQAQETTDYTNFVLLVYSARSVNAVLTTESGEPYKVLVTLNNKYLTESNKGDDVIIGENGESYLIVTDPKAYKIIEHPTWEHERTLRMGSLSDDFGLYSFTFGNYKDGF